MATDTLEGKIALVTGSAKGLGRELAFALADRGVSVIIHYRSSEEEAETVAETARSRGGGSSEAVQADLTDPTEVHSMFDSIESIHGGVDILINNVGDFAPEHWRELSTERWQQVMNTNFTATYLCSRRALERMEEMPYGRIINIGYASSERGLVNPVNFPYFVAKTGVLMFTRMLAFDTQDSGVTVNAVSPYVIENSEAFPESLPQDRPATFEDVIRPVLFFLDPENDYISGENIEVDGGWLPERV